MPLDRLLDTVRQVGWRDAYVAAPTDLTRPLSGDPETAAAGLTRVYLVARR